MVAVAQMISGRPSESQHWYAKDGSPCYETRGANGITRPVTLRDARKLGLVPGVSTIIAMEAKPMLERWKIEQALLAALTLPRVANESDDQFVHRAREDSQQQARKAAERGTEIHAMIQGHFEGRRYPREVAPFVEPVIAWISQRYGLQDWQAEQSFSSPKGFGGKADLISHSRRVIIDIKGKEFDEEAAGKDLAYPEHCTQLGAYALGFGFIEADCINIFFHRTKPGLIRVREWDREEIAEGRRAFELLLELYKIRKRFDPSWSQS